MGLVNSAVFRPPRPAAYTEYSLVPKLFFTTSKLGVKIPIAINFQGRRKTFHGEADKKWLLFAHGNAEDLANATLWTTFISNSTGLLAMAYDYTGYGLSERDEDWLLKHPPLNIDKDEQIEDRELPSLSPSEEYFLADAEAVLIYAETELGLRRENAVVWGRSLGCSAVCHLAALSAQESRTFGGIILQAPFTSALETVAMTHLANPPAFDMLRNYDKIKAQGGFNSPTFVIHGMDDWIINWWHGREMASLVPDDLLWPPLYPPKCGHNDIEARCENFVAEIEEFIAFCIWRLED